MPEPKISSEYEDGRAQGWHEAIEALRDRATVTLMHFADAALYLDTGQLPSPVPGSSGVAVKP